MISKEYPTRSGSRHDEARTSALEPASSAPAGSGEHPTRTIDLRNPHRPPAYRLVRSLKKPRKIKLGELKYAGHLDPITRENGELLLNSIHETARLNGFGQGVLEQFVKEVLLNNYQINRRLEGNTFPDIKAPTFILGMPRTGSTYLFNLLGSTGHFRTLRNWETHKVASRKPVPLKRMESYLLIKLLHHFAPGMRTMHEIRVEGPEECSKMILSRFVSQMFPAMFNIPAYNEFLETADYLPTYAFYRQQLQILGDHGKQWMLKSPIHTQSLDSILKVFPDAKFIHLQRDFDEVLGSICSLTAAFRALTSDHLEGREIGAEVKKFLVRDNTRAEAILDAHRQRVLPIPYREFLNNPLKTVSSIFNFVGSELGKDHKKRIQKEMQISVPNKFGKHNYRLSDYF